MAFVLTFAILLGKLVLFRRASLFFDKVSCGITNRDWLWLRLGIG